MLGKQPHGGGGGISRREREQAEDARLLTLHLVLQTLTGTRLTVDRCDDTNIVGTLVSADDEMKCAVPQPHRPFINWH